MRATRTARPRSRGTTNATAIGHSPRAAEMKPIRCACENCNADPENIHCRRLTGLVICPPCRNAGHDNPKIQPTMDVEERGKLWR